MLLRYLLLVLELSVVTVVARVCLVKALRVREPQTEKWVVSLRACLGCIKMRFAIYIAV